MNLNSFFSPEGGDIGRLGLSEIISAFQDIITDYPLCAIESDVADMDMVHHNVSILNFVVNELKEKGKIDFEDSSFSSICK